MRFGSTLLVLLLSGLATTELEGQDAETPASILDSVFTTEQADRGEDVFMRICIDCHLPEEFVDGRYLLSWEGQPLADMFEYVRDNMPEDNPGSLRNREYLSVLTYILKINGIPAGSRDLTSDLASAVRIELP